MYSFKQVFKNVQVPMKTENLNTQEVTSRLIIIIILLRSQWNHMSKQKSCLHKKRQVELRFNSFNIGINNEY